MMHEAKGITRNAWTEGYAGLVTLDPISVSKTLTFDRLLTWNMAGRARLTVPGERGAYSCNSDRVACSRRA